MLLRKLLVLFFTTMFVVDISIINPFRTSFLASKKGLLTICRIQTFSRSHSAHRERKKEHKCLLRSWLMHAIFFNLVGLVDSCCAQSPRMKTQWQQVHHIEACTKVLCNHTLDIVAPLGASVVYRRTTKISKSCRKNSYGATAKPIIKKLGLHTVSEVMQMETVSIVYKSIKWSGSHLAPTDMAPTYFTEIISKILDTCKRELPNSRTNLETTMRKSAYGQKCYSYKRCNNI